MLRYPALYALIDTVCHELADHPRLAAVFARCFPNTLETTIQLVPNETTFVITGDIPAMWLRDSSAQVHPYMRLAPQDADLRTMLRGLISRQVQCIQMDPYANAFNLEPNHHGHTGDIPPKGPWVWERKFELDSLCYPVWLLHTYWQTTNDKSIFDAQVHKTLHTIVATMQIEQHHDERSAYTFQRPDPYLPTDTLPYSGKGTRTNFTGMIWSGFRPSDDRCAFHYLIPANMFAAVILGHIETIARDIYRDDQLCAAALQLKDDIEYGIQTYGVVEHPRYGRIYAYETDGYGHFSLMDDANVPSLLSIPYLGYRPADDRLYQNTRRFVLSQDNPYYFEGSHVRGIGSPHTPEGYVWPIALAIQGLTATDSSEREALVHVLADTTAGTDMMHESFHPSDPAQFTRPWFAWANSLFCELLLMHLDDKRAHIGIGEHVRYIAQ